MKMLKWTLISLVGVLALGGTGGWLALHSWLEKNATREAVIQHLEAEWNCRADLDNLTVNLFSSPARISVRRLVLHERDEEVAKALAQRKPMASAARVLIGAAELQVDWRQLLAGRLHVQSLVVDDVLVREEITPDGQSSLGKIFEKAPTQSHDSGSPPGPALLSESTASTPDAKPVTAEKLISSPKQETQAMAKTSSLELPFGIRVDEALIRGLDASLLNRQAKTRTSIKKLRLRISDVDVDTGNLAEHNQCTVEIGGDVESSARMRVAEEMQEVQIAAFTFSGQGLVHPFDAATGEALPQASITLALKKGSTFGGTTTIGQAAAKDKSFANMKKNFGVDISDVIIGGALQNDVSTDVVLKSGKVEFTKEARFDFAAYAATLRTGSWIDAPNDDHQLALQLVPSEVLAKKITDGVTARMGDGVAKIALSVFNDGAGHLAFDFVSTERLSKPKVGLGGNAGAIEQLFKGLGGGVLQQFIGK